MLYWYCGKATRLEWAKRPINCNQEGFNIWYLGECHKIFVAASYRPYIHFMIFAQPLMLNLVISSTGLCLSSSSHNDHRIILCINFAKIFMVELCEISTENVTQVAIMVYDVNTCMYTDAIFMNLHFNVFF